MALITWTASQFGTNVPSLDYEQKIFIDKLNKLYDLAAGGAARSETGEQLDDLISYVVYHSDHYDHEEREMLAKGYASYPRYKEKHEALSALLVIGVDLQKKIHVGVADFNEEVGQWLNDWVVKFTPIFDVTYEATLTPDPGPSVKKR